MTKKNALFLSSSCLGSSHFQYLYLRGQSLFIKGGGDGGVLLFHIKIYLIPL